MTSLPTWSRDKTRFCLYLGSPLTDYAEICTVYVGGYGLQYSKGTICLNEKWVNSRKLKLYVVYISTSLRLIVL